MKRRTSAMLFLICGACSMVASAQDRFEGFRERKVEVSPFVGVRFGGDMDTFDNSVSGLDVQEDAAFGLTIDIDTGKRAQVEFLYSHSAMDIQSTPSCDCSGLEMTAEYLHIGLLNYWNWNRTQGFLVTSGGATFLDGNRGSFRESTEWSAALGGGVKVPLGKRVGLRFEARTYATFVDKDDGVFCRSPETCLMRHSDSVLWQFEGVAGVIVGFGKH